MATKPKHARRSRRPTAAHPTRQYSRAFTPRTGEGREYKMTRIPPALWTQVQRKARREGVSLRALILTHLSTWVGLPPAPPPVPPAQ